MVNLIIPQDQVSEVDQTLQLVTVDDRQPVPVHVQRSQRLQAKESVRRDLADGVAGQSEVHQARHVDEVFPPDGRDEVVGQTQLDGLAVDGGRHKEQAGFGTEERERGRDGLTDAAARAMLRLHQRAEHHHVKHQPLHDSSAS